VLRCRTDRPRARRDGHGDEHELETGSRLLCGVCRASLPPTCSGAPWRARLCESLWCV
jgi:hypothetical protein